MLVTSTHCSVPGRSLDEVYYAISSQRAQSFCPGVCGFRASRIGYKWYWRGVGEEEGAQGGLLVGGRSEDGEEADDQGGDSGHWPPHRQGLVGPRQRQLVCVMPRKQAERMVSLHHNCLTDAGMKQRHMEAWRNWTFDEERYRAEVEKDPDQAMSPDW